MALKKVDQINTIMAKLIKNIRDMASQELNLLEKKAHPLATTVQERHNERPQLRSHLGKLEHLDKPTVTTILDFHDALYKRAKSEYEANYRKRQLHHDLICSCTRALKKQKTTEPPPEPPTKVRFFDGAITIDLGSNFNEPEIMVSYTSLSEGGGGGEDSFCVDGTNTLKIDGLDTRNKWEIVVKLPDGPKTYLASAEE